MIFANPKTPSNDHTSCNPSKAKSSGGCLEADGRSASDDGADDSSSLNEAPAFRRVTRQTSRDRDRREAPLVLRRSARLRSDLENQPSGGRSVTKRPSRLRRSARIAILSATISSTGGSSALSRMTTRSRSSLLLNQHQSRSLSSSMNLRRSSRHRSS